MAKQRLTERIWVTPRTAKKLKIKKLESNSKSVDQFLSNILDDEGEKRENGFKFPKI